MTDRSDDQHRTDSALRRQLNAVLEEEAQIERDAAGPGVVAAELAAIMGRTNPPARAKPRNRLSRTDYKLRVARNDEIDVVLGLIDQAAEWLRVVKQTTQWAQPWPSPEGRRRRVYEDLVNAATWVLFHAERPIGTVTIKLLGDEELWTPKERKTDAVYLDRLVIDRAYAGIGLGAELIDWAGDKGASQLPSTELIRIAVWTDNSELHDYFRRQGFKDVAIRSTSDNTPSGALFARPLSRADRATGRLREAPG
ncbi:GNAT family N-acetyltransferase [Actinomadura sp. NAK00032]|uniref:GNAT family N-acetyltransferase n=1 Tax=Actinomadura sp. NAK00032 TaxID=2742128 RepID=UPI001590B1C4|nr:GNAT family N-acetyltransferase [Actinomadura sp. NAK00032]QKW36292.1 GNAT family N-acetyltransferase [Actinomadura sp. NAK00032]